MEDDPVMKAGMVTIIGRPNAGKSTLLNGLVGQRVSIVSEKPQTTRHRIVGVRTESRGQIVFIDTPGIHKPGYAMNRRMLESVHEALNGVDLVLLVVDGSAAPGAGESFTLDLVKRMARPAMALINKIDRIAKPRLLPIIDRYARQYGFIEIVPISALTGENLALVVDLVFRYIPAGEPLYDAEIVTDRPERFLASELIREKVLSRTREELPYATAVIVRRFDESERETRNLVRIEADIIVEKKSQAGIIVGKRGHVLRDIGSAARRDIEELLGCHVYLGLQVRDVTHWRNDEAILDQLELGNR